MVIKDLLAGIGAGEVKMLVEVGRKVVKGCNTRSIYIYTHLDLFFFWGGGIMKSKVDLLDIVAVCFCVSSFMSILQNARKLDMQVTLQGEDPRTNQA